ncbi:TPA: hypothetical protein JD320_002145 [Citrobacter koseri]|nr:hypothetical protein [Citrobacter koseri]HDQ2604881.1 hypothetical protein [Citrobacter koseri]
MKTSVSMITRSISVALLVSAVPSVQAATSWMEARGDAMGGTPSPASPSSMPATLKCWRCWMSWKPQSSETLS